jgi:uncharacterized membrane protein YGL010W
MRSLEDRLTNYANYHRDRRNIVTHFIGIPMIMVAVTGLLSRPFWWVAAAAGFSFCVYYFLLDLRFAIAMTAFFSLAVWAGNSIALQSTTVWLAVSLGLFVIGWIFQFLGHYYEGKKPAFFDDLANTLIGPLFIAAEAAFMLGLRPALKVAIEAKSGPTRNGTKQKVLAER